MLINASSLSYQALNEAIRKGGIECRIEGCLGQRFIAAGMEMPWAPISTERTLR